MGWRKYTKSKSIYKETLPRTHSASKRQCKYIRGSNIWRRKVRFFNLQPTFLQWRRWQKIKKVKCVPDLGFGRLHTRWWNRLSLENGSGKFTIFKLDNLVHFINWQENNFQFHDNLSERDVRYWRSRYHHSNSWNIRRDDQKVGDCMEIHLI